ncbi:MAG TPA: ribosomal-processing cysteine protease Prp [Firmicutes bacterium]|nr:ribosomal-processing cysteine protease Prp [Bacillota bacterium]
MICVECTKKDNKIVNLVINGHANSAPLGKDLVCAAVSGITFGGLNNLEKPKNFVINTNEKDGYIEINALNDVPMHDYIVLETILTQLKTVAENSPKYIKVIEKGC